MEWLKSFFSPIVAIISVLGIITAYALARHKTKAAQRHEDIALVLSANSDHTRRSLAKASKHRDKAISHAVKANEIRAKAKKKLGGMKDATIQDIFSDIQRLTAD